MRVRITQSFAEAYQTYAPGQELDVPDERGVAMLQLQVAERIESIPETAAMPNRGERAVRMARAGK
jgi:hypothetical protein